MTIRGCKDQGPSHYLAFFKRMSGSSDSAVANRGMTMLRLISQLNDLQDDRTVWALTSHESLCLLSKDSYDSNWNIIVTIEDPVNIRIEFLMPADTAPWPNAYVTGVARTEVKAVEMIKKALEASQGWQVG